MSLIYIGKSGHKKVFITPFSIDPQGGCLYLQFSSEKVAETQEHTDFINIDLDKKGGLVGIEFVGFKRRGLDI